MIPSIDFPNKTNPLIQWFPYPSSPPNGLCPLAPTELRQARQVHHMPRQTRQQLGPGPCFSTAQQRLWWLGTMGTKDSMGISWDFMGFHGISWDFMGILWGFHGILWGFHGISWDFMGISLLGWFVIRYCNFWVDARYVVTSHGVYKPTMQSWWLKDEWLVVWTHQNNMT